MCGSDSITIHPRNIPRAIVVFESRAERSTFQLLHVESAQEAIQHLTSSPAVFAWLPAGAYGILRPRINLDADPETPRYIFDFEVCNSAAIRQNAAVTETETTELEVTYVSTDSSDPDVPEWEYIECPTGSNHMQLIFCQNGSSAHCNDETGAVTCEQPYL